MINSSGARLEPCGTPCSINFRLDKCSCIMLSMTPVTAVHCCLSVMKDISQSNAAPRTPAAYNLRDRIARLTVPNALVRSKNIFATKFPASNCEKMLHNVQYMANSISLCGIKPNWLSEKKLFFMRNHINLLYIIKHKQELIS